ncbi:MAG: hypothetical protein O3B24_05970 [Verrucomicrobia bacterium]|nr:hypothetical protein [Verrucomicrobiota bacterium]
MNLQYWQWNHVAAVGDGQNVTLYIDAILDTQGPYFRRINPPAATITAYIQFEDVATVLRIGQGGFDGIIDEASFWNDFLDPIEIARHATFGLSLADVAQQIQYYGFAPLPLGNAGMTPPWKTVPPTGAVAAGPGGTGVRHKRLVSYVVYDGTAQQAIFIDDLANAAVPYRILPLTSGSEIVSVGRPPIAVDGLSRSFGKKMTGYFPGSDGTGVSPGNVENYMLRNSLVAGGVFSAAGANFVDLDKTDPVATEFLIMDSDNDGMPDWWETANGIDPSAEDADEDRDGDGLSNLAEYQSGNKAFDPDSDGDGITDDAEDPDGDGLTNIQEQNVTHTHAGLYDTDDDGFSDNEEVIMGTDPLNGYSPSRPGAYQFDGTGRLKVRTELIGRVPLTSRETVTDLSRSWTVEAWIQTTNTIGEQIVLRRWAQYSGGATNWLHYELGVSNGWPYVSYQAGNARTNLITAVAPTNSLYLLSTNWTHIAGVLDLNGSQLRLYVDGRRVTSVVAQPVPQILYDKVFETTIGGGDLVPGGVERGFVGMIDAVRTWDYVRSGFEIQQARGVLLPEHSGLTPDEIRSPKRLFNFDDCSVGPSTNSLYAQNSHYVNDWMIGWPHVAQATTSGVVWIATPFPPLNLDSDDDSLSDEDERTRNSNVNRSESPFLARYLHFPNSVGVSNTVVVDEQVDAEETGIYALTNWSVEAWVRPTTVASGRLVPLIQRRTKEAPGWATFELGLTNSAGQIRPYALFDRDDAGHSRVMLLGNAPTVNIRTGTNAAAWNHLAATFAGGRFSLYFDGNEVALSQVIGAGPVGTIGGIVTIGSPGFEGDMREIRIWNTPRTALEITESYRKTLLFSPALLQNVYNADQNAFLGRATQPEENGLLYDFSEISKFRTLEYVSGLQTHKFAMEAWVKMERGAPGGIVVERKIDVNLLATEPDWRVNNSLRISPEGRPQGVWQGQVSVVTPVFVPPALLVLSRLDVNQEIITRNLTSEVDIRDGTWHHLALVGDSTKITLYIDGIRDAEKPYYTFMTRPAPRFESFFFTYPPTNSVLRVAEEGIKAHIDEVMVWNEDISQESVIQHMKFGMSARDITQGLLDIAPIPESAVGSGHHQRLVSYLTFDGVISPPWVQDEANDLLPYRMLPLPAGNEIIVNARPPVSVDRLRGFEGKLAGYLGSVDGGKTVENYMQRNDLGYAGVMQSGVVFRVSAVDGTPEFAIGDSDSDELPDWWEIEHGLDPGSAQGADGAYGDPDGDGLTNAAELEAGTSPMEPDSDRDGLSDFFSWDLTTTNEFRIYGERFTDFDGMEDGWEVHEGLDPRRYDSHEDADSDGWSNGSEARVPTAPQDLGAYPVPSIHVHVNYKGFRTEGPIVANIYSRPQMDGIPDAVGILGNSQTIPFSQLGGSGPQSTTVVNGQLTTVPVVPGSASISIGLSGSR